MGFLNFFHLQEKIENMIRIIMLTRGHCGLCIITNLKRKRG